MAGLHFEITGDEAPLRRSLERVKQATRETTSEMERSGASIETMFSRIKSAAAIAATGMSFKQLAGQVMQVRGEFQQLEVAFTTMLGNAEKADNLMAQLVKTAAITPFDLKGVAGGAKQLLAYGMEAEKVNETLIRLGDISAGLSLNLGDMVYLYGTTMAQGRLYTQDLIQFTGRGIPMISELAKQFGVAESEVKDLVTAGKVGFPEVQKVIESLTNNGGKFGGLMEEQSKTITGQISNIEDAIDVMYNEIGKQSEGIINSSLEMVGWVVEHWKEVGNAVMTVASSYGVYKASVMLVAAAEQARISNELHASELRQKALQEEIVQKKALLETANGGTASQAASNATKSPQVAAAIEQETVQRQILIDLEQEAVKRVELAAQVKGQAVAALTEAQSRHALAVTEYDLSAERATQAQSELSLAIQRKQIADEQVATAVEYLQLQEEIAEAGGEEDENAYAELNAALKEQEAAATELQTATEAANTTEKQFNTAATQLQTAETELATAAKEADTAATNLQTATEARNAIVTNTSTAATNANTAATAKQTVTTRLATLASKVATGAQALWTAAVRMTTGAMQGLKAAIMSNPIGLLVTAVTSLVTAFVMFRDETDEATEASEKFGEATTKTMNNVSSLYAIINTAKVGSKAYNEAMSQLVSISKEYGLSIDEEGNKIDQLNEKRSELIQLIRREGEERQYANTIQTINENYEKEIEKIKADITEGLDDVKGTVAQTYSELLTNNLAANAEEMNKYWAEFTSFNRSGDFKAAQEALRKYNELFDQSVASVQRAAIANGESASTIRSIREAAADALPEIRKAKEEQNASAEAAERVHRENAKATDSMNGLTAATARSNRQAELAGKTITQLGEIISGLTKDYGENVINFRVRLHTKGLPDWMKQQLNLGKATERDVKAAGSNTAYWTSALEQMERQGAKVFRRQEKGHWKEYTKEMVAQNAMMWQYGGEQAQQEVTARLKKAEEEKDKKPVNRGHKSGKTLEEMNAERRRKIDAENRSYNEEEAKRQREYANQKEQSEIDRMEEGTEKRLRQLKLDHKREQDEIWDEYDDLKKTRQEHARRLFEADEKNKGKDFTATEAYKNIDASDEDYRHLARRWDDAELKTRKAAQEVLNEEVQSWRDYLKDYGTFQEQKLALTSEYADKIAKAENDTMRRRLVKERDNALASLEAQHLSLNIDWGVTFEGVGTVLKDIAKETLSEVDRFIKSKDFNALPEPRKKAYTDYRRELNKAATGESSSAFNFAIWGEIDRLVKEYKSSVERLKTVSSIHALAVNNLKKAQNDLAAATTDAEKQIAENNVKITQGEVDRTSENLENAQSQTTNAQNDLTDASDKAANGLRNFGSYLSKMGSGSLYGFANGVSKLITSLQKGSDGVGKALGELGGKIGGIIGAILQILDALGDDPAQFIKDLLDSVADAVYGFLSNLDGILESVVSGVGNIVGGVFQGLGDLFLGSRESDPKLADDIKENTKAIDANTQALSNLSEDIKNATTEERQSILAQQQWLFKNNEERLKDQNKREGDASDRKTHSADWLIDKAFFEAAYEFSSGGFLIHSYKQYIEQINNLLRKEVTVDDVLKNLENPEDYTFEQIIEMANNANKAQIVGSAEDIWSLSPEQLLKIQTYLPEVWAAMKKASEDALYDPIKTAEERIENYKQQLEAQREFFADILTFSFNDVESGFRDALRNMQDATKAFADDFEEQMRDAVLNSVLDSADVKAAMQAYYDYIGQATLSDGKLTAEEIAEAERLYNEAHDLATQRQKDALETAGLTEVSQTQEGEKRGFAAMGQDTAEELNGRFTALQIAGERVAGISEILLNNVTEQLTAVQAIGNQLDTMAVLAVDRNAMLADLASDTHKMFAEWGARIERIETNTNYLTRL